MSWLRIDDSFGDHPKLLMLTRGERWTFVELLTYCAKHRTEGYFPSTLKESRRYVTESFLEKCLDAGLIDRDQATGELKIHDWSDFNPTKDPTGAVRQQRWRNAKRNGGTVTDVTKNVTGDVTASRARDPVPLPSPSVSDTPTPSSSNEANYARTLDQPDFAAALGQRQGQEDAHAQDQDDDLWR